MKTRGTKSVREADISASSKSVSPEMAPHNFASRIGNRALGRIMAGPAKAAASIAPVSDHKSDSRPQLRGVTSNVVQRKAKVPESMETEADAFGQFETTKLEPYHDSGVEITLLFHPNKNKADAKKIALSQSVKITDDSGNPFASSPTMAGRMVQSGDAKGYTIDASGKTNNPIYFDTKNLGPNEELKDTPMSNVKGTDKPKVGENTHYELGFSFKQKDTDKERTTQPAGINDKPEGIQRKGYGMMFETAALAIDGVDKGQYYGSVKWGYKVGGTAENPKVEPKDVIDITRASKGTPTANFIEPAKLWNASTTAGGLEVNPTGGGNTKDAWVQYVQGSGPKRVAKGTKLKLVRVIKGTTEGMIQAEVLDAEGKVSAVVNIYVTDVKDTGSGTPNKPLPIPK